MGYDCAAELTPLGFPIRKTRRGGFARAYQQETVVLVSVQFPAPIAFLIHVMLRPVGAQCAVELHCPFLGPDPWL